MIGWWAAGGVTIAVALLAVWMVTRDTGERPVAAGPSQSEQRGPATPGGVTDERPAPVQATEPANARTAVASDASSDALSETDDAPTTPDAPAAPVADSDINSDEAGNFTPPPVVEVPLPSRLAMSLVDPVPQDASWKVPAGDEWSFEGDSWASVAYLPPTPSSRVLFADKGKNVFGVADWATDRPAQMMRLISPQEGFRPGSEVSPDGRFVLGEYQASSSTSRILALADVERGAIGARLEGTSSAPRFAEFVSSELLLVVDRERQGPWTVFVFEAMTGTLRHSFALPTPAPPYDSLTPTFAVSPGRRFLAYGTADGSLRMFEIESGKEAGELHFDKPERRYASPRHFAYSPDGRELAVWYKFGEHPSGPDHSRIVLWDLETGETLQSHNFAVSLSRHVPTQDEAMQQLLWLPDNRGWLAFGHWIIDRESGKIVAVLPAPEQLISLAITQPLQNGRILQAWSTPPPSGRGYKVVIRTIPLPLEDISSGQEQARAGTQPAIPNLPSERIPDIL